jgi:hypothetical protein
VRRAWSNAFAGISPYAYLRLAELTAIDPDDSTEEAIGGWHYWIAQGYLF